MTKLKDIKRLILFLFILTIIILLKPPEGESATIQERQALYKEGTMLCMEHSTSCTIKEFNSPHGNAMTQYNNIWVSTQMAERLPVNEIRAIMYHEIGHVVLKHSNSGLAFMDRYYKMGRYPTVEEVRKFRHKNEFEADNFASIALRVHNYHNDFDKALMHITTPGEYEYSSNSHPSPKIRIKRIKQLKKQLGN